MPNLSILIFFYIKQDMIMSIKNRYEYKYIYKGTRDNLFNKCTFYSKRKLNSETQTNIILAKNSSVQF